MKKPKKVLLLGSGALQIGQAGEFDYSGSQAIKALKEEGIEVILINPNIATIQTSEDLASKVYFLPIEPHFVEEIIKKENPDGILLSFGGQTALNCGIALNKSGVLKKNNIQILGTPISAIEVTEDRKKFAQNLKKLGLKIPKSAAAKSLKEAKKEIASIGFPVIVRSAFTLGGQDSMVCFNKKHLEEAVFKALSKSPQVLIEEYLEGWKELEYEVVRDKFDNCITVCNMENIDPMGIHTGESIVVAPSQTLNNNEYHTLRQVAIKVIRNLGIVGECNIQFALNPRPLAAESAGNSLLEPSMNNSEKAKGKNRRTSIIKEGDLDYRIIEVNARLSRSSALASKATGYPLAYVAAKLGLGYSLTEIKNSVTKKTIACFEPALDYLVVKIPRWDLSKFLKSQNTIGPYMQSVGEVMAIGRKFEEALQKAVRMLDIGVDGVLDKNAPNGNFQKPTPSRIFDIAHALSAGTPTKEINKKTAIDLFFLEKIKNISQIEKSLKKEKVLNKETLINAKKHGFSDKGIAKAIGVAEKDIREKRNLYNIHPSVKQIDTLAAEFPAETNYLYLTYNGQKDDTSQSSIDNQQSTINNQQSSIESRKVIVLGSGPYRIGSSVEFDWCSVTCALSAKKLGFETIIINCNPETVSTDFDMASKLYFDEISTESIVEIYQKEKASGVIVSMGGQTPNNLVNDLFKNEIKILGTSPVSIDIAEDRSKFSNLCDTLGIDQPKWAKLENTKDAIKFASKISYPVLIRPSYVLSGAAMNLAFNPQDLENYLKEAVRISNEYPVVISKFLEDAKEIEIDAVAKDGDLLTYAISEHIENAGVHSGDSTLVLPAQKIYLETEKQILKIATKIAESLKITGPFNIQFLAKENKVLVIECNLRASRSLPFVSKVSGINFVKVATSAILNVKNQKTLSNVNAVKNGQTLSYVGVKAPQFSFSRVKGADPVLRVEMASTGEVACFGQDLEEAFLKALIASGTKLPKKSVYISLGGDKNKVKFTEESRLLKNLGLKIYATTGTHKFLKANGIESTMVYKIRENKNRNVLDVIRSKKIDFVINIFDRYLEEETEDGYLIRRATVDFGIPIITNLQTAELFVRSITEKKLEDLKILPWQDYVTIKN